MIFLFLFLNLTELLWQQLGKLCIVGYSVTSRPALRCPARRAGPLSAYSSRATPHNTPYLLH